MKNFLFFLNFLLIYCLQSPAQILQFDSLPGTAGIQNGNGVWNTTTDVKHWWNGTENVLWSNTGSVIASFGVNSSATGGTITVSGTINLAGMKFNSLSALPVTIAHTFTGGTLAFSNDAVIEASTNTSSGSSGTLFINLNSTLTGHNLTLQRNPTDTAGTFQYIRFGSTAGNPNLTGTLTLKSLTPTLATFGLFAASNTVSGFSEIVVENGSVFAASGVGSVYAMDFKFNGIGNGSGAFRFDSNNITISGNILLQSSAGVVTNGALTGIISGNISDGGNNYNFQPFSGNPESILQIAGVNTYGGSTILGRSGGSTAGTTILDFSAATAPVSDIVYNGLANPGNLELWGALVGKTILRLQGKNGVSNSQRFNNLVVNDSYSNIVIQPGVGGSMHMSFGTIARATATSEGAINIAIAPGGSVSTTMADGFVAPWATFTDDKGRLGWAAALNGTLSHFAGEISISDGVPIVETPGLSASSHLYVSESNIDPIISLGAASTINTLTFSGPLDYILDLTGGPLRFGTVGGIQLADGAGDLDIGTTGGIVGNTNTSQLWLTNASASSELRVHTVLANNGGGALGIYINGRGNTVLTANNIYTGRTHIVEGASLEIRHNNALGGTATGTYVFSGGSLRLANSITISEPLFIVGTGINSTGAIRNLEGVNTINSVIALQNAAMITADAGTTLIIDAAAADTTRISGTTALTIGGSGDIIINGRIAIAAGTLTKTGNGRLTINGDSTYTGATTINGGTLRITHNNALGTAAGAVAANANASLELDFTEGATIAKNINITGLGYQNQGAIHNVQGHNTLSGIIGISNASGTIFADAGTSLTLSGTLRNGGAANTRAVFLGGAGDIYITGLVTNGTTPATFITALAKTGAGTAYLRPTASTNTYTGLTTLQGGTLVLDFANAAVNASLIPGNNGLVLSDGKLQVTGKPGINHVQGFATTRLGTVINNATFTVFTIADSSGGFGGGTNTLELSPGAGGSINLALGHLIREAKSGHIVNILTPAAGSSITTTSLNTNGILNGGMTVDKQTWATSAATQVSNVSWSNSANTIALGGFTNGSQISFSGTAPGGLLPNTAYYVINADGTKFQVATTPGGTAIDLTNDGNNGVLNRSGAITGLLNAAYSSTFTANANVDVPAGATTLDAMTVNSLRFNDPEGATLSLSGTFTNLSGGILITENVTGNVTLQSNSATVRTLDTSATTSELLIHHHGSGILTLASTITLTNTLALTKTGAGTVNFAAVDNATNVHLRVLEGTFNILGNSRFASTQPHTDLTIGTATTTATVSFGNGAATGTHTFNAIRLAGTGSRIIGNGSGIFAVVLNGGGTQNLTKLMIGGLGENENNLSISATSATIVQFGPANTYAGRTGIDRAIFEATVLANVGEPSSFGTGTLYPAIEMNFTTSTADTLSVLRYVGDANSSTDRPIRLITNGQTMPSLTAVIENNGAGTLQFTSPFTAEGTTTLPRLFRLTGTNTGLNEIVSMSAATNASSIVSLEKAGIGTWVLTGNSTYTGTTTITEGILQLGNGGSAGMVGTGNIIIHANATLITNRSDRFEIPNAISGAGKLLLQNQSDSVVVLSSSLSTYSGGTTLSSGSLIAANLDKVGSATGSGPVRAEQGTLLAGYGRMAPANGADITLINATLSVGDPALPYAAQLTIDTSSGGTLSLLSGSIFSFDLYSGAGAGDNTSNAVAADQAIILGTLHLGTNAMLQVINANSMTAWAVNDQWQLFDWSGLTGGITGTFASYDLPYLPEGLIWNTDDLLTTGVLSVGFVPEPSRCLLVMLGCLSLLSRRRR